MTITIDPKTGYSPELKARVEAEIARAKTFEPLAAADPDADLAWLVSDKDDVDVGYRFETPPPDLDFVWPGFLAGSVGALVAPGATGKSFWALEAMMSIACSVAGGDLAGLNPEKSGRVLYISAEDPRPVLEHRIHAIGAHLGIDARGSIAANLQVKPGMGKSFDVMDDRHLGALIKKCEGVRLVVLDTLSRIHFLDEKDNGRMARVVKQFERVADETGASVLYLHHCNKGSATSESTDQQQAARGASALIDNARWCGFVAKMTEDESKRLREPDSLSPVGSDRRDMFVRFGTSKQNYGGRLEDIWYMRKKGGVLVPVALTELGRGSSATGTTAPRAPNGKVGSKAKTRARTEQGGMAIVAQAISAAESGWINATPRAGNGGDW